MPLETSFDEIVDYIPGSGAPGDADLHRQGVMPPPMMLSEAIERGLQDITAGRRPSLVIRGLTYTDPEDFLALHALTTLPEC